MEGFEPNPASPTPFEDLTADQLTTSAWALAAMGEVRTSLMALLWKEMCQRGPAGLKGGRKGRRSLMRAHQVCLAPGSFWRTGKNGLSHIQLPLLPLGAGRTLAST